MIEWIKKKQGKKTIELLNYPFTFDTETSYIDGKGWIYSWAFKTEHKTYIGRTPSGFINLLDELRYIYGADTQNKKIVIYVHNLSYDLTYLYRFLYKYDNTMRVLWVDSRKALQVECGNFIFRCSYLLSNMSLEKWGEKLNIKHKKLVGTVDYSKVRFQDDKLTNKDWKYQIFDVISLQECILEEMKQNDDNIVTIPLTSTGYVRRDCRKAVAHDKKYHDWFLKTRLNVHTYKAFRKAFSGGYVHANRFIVGQTIKGEIEHFDYKSFYPSQQMLGYYPVTQFIPFYDCEKDGIVNSNILKEQLKTKCCLMEIAISNIQIKKGVTAPYLQACKMYGEMKQAKLDNGRVLYQKSRNVMYVTELDLDIIKRQYDCDIEICKMWVADRGEFPKQFKDIIMKFFEVKETLDDGYYRMKSKNKLNSIYGMSVTDIIRDLIAYDMYECKFEKKHYVTNEEIQEKLDTFYNSRNSFFPYQLGVYVTAQCRHQLIDMIEKVGYENFLYCDTDSIFFIKNEKAMKEIEKYNEEVKEKCMKLGYYVKNKNGDFSYFKTFEDEKEGIKAFRTLHSKCYAFIDKNDKLNVTIAGVSKVGRNNQTISSELKSIDNLDYGFVFKDCGSTLSTYNAHEICVEDIQGHEVEYADSIIITDNTKTIKGNSIKDCEMEEFYDVL